MRALGYHLAGTKPEELSLVHTPTKSTGHIPIRPEGTFRESQPKRLVHPIGTAYKEVKARVVKAFKGIPAGPLCHLQMTASCHQNHPASDRKLKLPPATGHLRYSKRNYRKNTS